jgi:amidase
VIRWNPCGSSSGSGTAAAASLAAATLGTETDGSIVCPSSANGLVGIKPSVGLTSRAGVIPISHSQDTVGPMARTVADAAALLGTLTGVDPRDPATSESDGFFFDDYTQFLAPDGLNGARIGIAREMWGFSPEADSVCEATIAAMTAAGATIVDPVLYPSIDEINSGEAEITVLLYEFKADLNAYLATRSPGSPRTLAELIAFNEANADVELRFFGQELFHLSEATTGLDDPVYLDALATARRIGREDGIDAVLAEHDLDAFVAPTGSPAWPTDLVNGDLFLGGSSSPAAVAGYPMVSMPAGFSFGLPVGISFVGARWSEPTLIRLASGFEAAVGARRPPRYLEQPEL